MTDQQPKPTPESAADWERDQTYAADLLHYADDTTSLYRWDIEIGGPVETMNFGDFTDDPEELRSILIALLERLVREWPTAPEALRQRCLEGLRQQLRDAPDYPDRRGRFLAAASIMVVLHVPGVVPADVVNGLVTRRMMVTTRTAVTALLDAIGREKERRAMGLPPDPDAILVEHDLPTRLMPKPRWRREQ